MAAATVTVPSGHDVSGGSGGKQGTVCAQEFHAGAGDPRAQAQDMGVQLKIGADAWSQVINSQINSTELAKAVQALHWSLLHMPGADGGHHSQATHRIETGADDPAVNPVKREMPD